MTTRNFVCSLDTDSSGNPTTTASAIIELDDGTRIRLTRKLDAKAQLREREARLTLQVPVGVTRRELIDRPSRHALLQLALSYATTTDGVLESRGSFFDIGSGSGNVVSHVAVFHTHQFDAVHAIDLVHPPGAIAEVEELVASHKDALPISWWKQGGLCGKHDEVARVTGDSCAATGGTKLTRLFAGATFVYSVDPLFAPQAVNDYRELLARSLQESAQQRTVFYLTFHPVDRKRRKDGQTTATPHGTDSLFIGPYVREVTQLRALKDVHVAWEDMTCYLVKLTSH